MGTKRPAKPKPPSGEEKKNQLDLFRWAAEAIAAAATATATAAVAAKDAATKTIEEMWAAFDKRCLALCGMQVPVLAAFSYRPLSAFTVVVVVAAGLSALLLVMPWVMRRIPSYTDRAARVGSSFVTALFIISVFALGADMVMPWLSSPPQVLAQQQQLAAPKVEVPTPQSPPDEKLLTEEAQREAATQAANEAARIAECLAKERAADKRANPSNGASRN